MSMQAGFPARLRRQVVTKKAARCPVFEAHDRYLSLRQVLLEKLKVQHPR